MTCKSQNSQRSRIITLYCEINRAHMTNKSRSISSLSLLCIFCTRFLRNNKVARRGQGFFFRYARQNSKGLFGIPRMMGKSIAYFRWETTRNLFCVFEKKNSFYQKFQNEIEFSGGGGGGNFIIAMLKLTLRGCEHSWPLSSVTHNMRL